MNREGLQQVALEVVKGTVLSAAASFWEKIFGPSEEKQLRTLTQQFVTSAQEEKPSHTEDEITEMLSATASILSVKDDKIKELVADDFSPAVFHGFIGVGKYKLQPDSLLEGLERLRTYADLKNHISDNLFTKDGRAHLILAITVIVGRAFSFQNSTKKLSWLRLSSLFIEKILASQYVKTKGWDLKSIVLGGQSETFFNALNNLKARIKESVDVIEAERTQRAAAAYIDDIEVEIDASRQYLKAIAGEFYQEEGTPLYHGRPRPADITRSPCLIGYFIDAVGFTLQPEKTYSEAIRETKETALAVKKPKITRQAVTEDFMAKIIAWASVNKDAVKDEKTDFPKEFKVRLDERTNDEEIERRKTAQFLAAFKNLATAGRIKLEENGNVVLYGIKPNTSLIRTSATEYGPILTIPMGIDKAFLKILGNSKPEDLDQHRQLLLKLEITKAQTVNAITSFFALCDSAKVLFEKYGDVYGAILLQKFFPAMQILIQAAKRNHKEISDLSTLLSRSSTELGQRVLSNEMFVRRLGGALARMDSLTADAEFSLAETLKGTADGTISLEKQLTEITASITNCKQLFSDSGMLEGLEESSLNEKIRAIGGQIKVVRALDKVNQVLADGTLNHPDRVLDSATVTQALATSRAQSRPSTPVSLAGSETTAVILPLPELKIEKKSDGVAPKLQKETVAVMVGKKNFDQKGGQTAKDHIAVLANIAEKASGETSRWGRWLATATWDSAQKAIKSMISEALVTVKSALIEGLNKGNLSNANASIDSAIKLLQAQAQKNGANAESKREYANKILELKTLQGNFENLKVSKQNILQIFTLREFSSGILIKALKLFDSQFDKAFKVIKSTEDKALATFWSTCSQKLWYQILFDERNPLLKEVNDLRHQLNKYCQNGELVDSFDSVAVAKILGRIEHIQDENNFQKLKRRHNDENNPALTDFFGEVGKTLNAMSQKANALLENNKAQEKNQQEQAIRLERERLNSRSTSRASSHTRTISSSVISRSEEFSVLPQGRTGDTHVDELLDLLEGSTYLNCKGCAYVADEKQMRDDDPLNAFLNRAGSERLVAFKKSVESAVSALKEVKEEALLDPAQFSQRVLQRLSTFVGKTALGSPGDHTKRKLAAMHEFCVSYLYLLNKNSEVTETQLIALKRCLQSDFSNRKSYGVDGGENTGTYGKILVRMLAEDPLYQMPQHAQLTTYAPLDVSTATRMFQTGTQVRLRSKPAGDILGQINKILRENIALEYLNGGKLTGNFTKVGSFLEALSNSQRASRLKTIMEGFTIAMLPDNFEDFKKSFFTKVTELTSQIHFYKAVATDSKEYRYRERKVAMVILLLMAIEKFNLAKNTEGLAQLASCAVQDFVQNYKSAYIGESEKTGSFKRSMDALETIISEDHTIQLLSAPR